MAILVLSNYVSVDEYAVLCSISRRSVLGRIRSGTVSAIKVDGFYSIDIQNNPPKKFAHHKSRKTTGGAGNPYPELRAVIRWCHGKGLRSYAYMRAIIVGKMDGWAIAGEVFARSADLEAFQNK